MNSQKERICQTIKADGSQCSARPLAGSISCFFHDPAKARERKVARRAGGVARSHQAAVLPRETPDLPLRKVSEVVDLLAETLNQVRRGQLDPKVGTSMAYICGVLLKALEMGPLEERLAILEASVQQPPSLCGRS